MATDPRDRLQRELETIEELAADPDSPMTDTERDMLLELADAMDPQTVRHTFETADDGTKTFKPRTIASYMRNLRICVEEGYDLRTDGADAFNDRMDSKHDDDGLEKATLAAYQCAAQAFYQYHDLGVDTEEINVFGARSDPKHDEHDMFSEEDVEALRRACGETQNTTRNRALLELLIFTGQRLSALLTLRLKDVDVEDGYIYLNDEFDEEHGGLKGARRRGRKRPMFGARKYVRDWIQQHPQRDDPDAWLFVGNPSHWKTNLDDHWAGPSADQVLRRIKEYAGVEKPVNAHNFRHYCGTVLYRDYDVDRDTIRMLFGHVEGSSALEETYSHVFDDDYIRKAEEALGYREPEERSPWTPETCPTCGELIKNGWRQCPNCQEEFAPGQERLEEIADDIERDAAEVALEESLTADEKAGIKALLEVVDDPAALATKLAEE